MAKEKIIAAVCLAFALTLFGKVSVPAQIKKFALYAAPQRLKLKSDERENERTLLVEKFYPIGWSRDGKFAYYTEPADEACGCYLGDFYIVDLKTDEVLWSRRYTSEEGKAETLKDYWEKNQREFSAKLARHWIEAVNIFRLENFPLRHKTDRLNADLKADLTETENTSVKGSVLLELASARKGRKTLYQASYSPEKYDSIRGAEIGGALVSPFEPRAAIVLIETHRGWEGPPSITRIRIVGAHLENSFQASQISK